MADNTMTQVQEQLCHRFTKLLLSPKLVQGNQLIPITNTAELPILRELRWNWR